MDDNPTLPPAGEPGADLAESALDALRDLWEEVVSGDRPKYPGGVGRAAGRALVKRGLAQSLGRAVHESYRAQIGEAEPERYDRFRLTDAGMKLARACFPARIVESEDVSRPLPATPAGKPKPRRGPRRGRSRDANAAAMEEEMEHCARGLELSKSIKADVRAAHGILGRAKVNQGELKRLACHPLTDTVETGLHLAHDHLAAAVEDMDAASRGEVQPRSFP